MTLLDRIAPETSRRIMPVLATERLVLRAPELEDAATVAKLANDRRIAENTLRIPYPYSLADAEAFISGANASDRETAFLITARGAVIGACGIAMLDGKTPELGYWLGLPFWDQGFATEAARAVIDHAFGALGHDTLLAGARVTAEQDGVPESLLCPSDCGGIDRRHRRAVDGMIWLGGHGPQPSRAEGTNGSPCVSVSWRMINFWRTRWAEPARRPSHHIRAALLCGACRCSPARESTNRSARRRSSSRCLSRRSRIVASSDRCKLTASICSVA